MKLILSKWAFLMLSIDLMLTIDRTIFCEFVVLNFLFQNLNRLKQCKIVRCFVFTVVRRKTIYEYHKVDKKTEKVTNGSAIYFTALNSYMHCLQLL